MLLISAGLMLRSLLAIGRIDPGFDPHDVLTATLPFSATQYPGPRPAEAAFARVAERVRALPGVEAAGFIDSLPLSGGSMQPVAFEGRPVPQMADQPEVAVRVITPGYLEAMHIAVRRGRRLGDADAAGRVPVALISEAMAQRFWPHQDPIGQHLTLSFFPGISREIVGIVADTKIDRLQETSPAAAVYYPLAQLTMPAGSPWRGFALSLVVRTSPPPASMVDTIGSAVRGVVPAQPLTDVLTMEQIMGEALAQPQLNAALLATFAGLALLLATLGIYSVLAYAVRRRRREIGIRMALGAKLQDVVRLVVVEAMRPTLIGMAFGVAGALAIGRLLSSLIYGVSVSDPLTFVAVAVLFVTVAIVASLVPSLQACRVDPMTTLRDE